MIAKTDEEITGLRTAGRLLAECLREVAAKAAPGVSAAALDLAAEEAVRSRGAVPAFLGYKPEGASSPYPTALCISINEEITHGIPTEGRVLKEGDIVSLDLGLSFNGFFADMAVTVLVGEGTDDDRRLIEGSREATKAAIAAARAGGHIGDIGAAVERVAKKYNLSIIEDLGGHSLGRAVHEKPYVPNEGKEGEGGKIAEGLVLAIEPMLSLGKGAIVLEADDWTYSTADGSRSATFEHTILVKKDGAEILTA